MQTEQWLLCSRPKMNALDHIVGNRWLANAALAASILLASTALYLGVGYYTLFGSLPDAFLDWFWPLSCLVVFALALTATTNLIHRVYRRGISSAFLLGLAGILGVGILVAVIVSLALFRTVK